MTVELDQPTKPRRSVNQVVNEALQLWAKVTGAKPKDYTVKLFGQSEAFSGYELSMFVESLNQSRELDPTGITTLMMLRGLVEEHLKTHMFTLYDLLVSKDDTNKSLEEAKLLRDMVEDPDFAGIIDGFVERIRQAADHYEVPGGRKNKRLNELLANRFRLAMLRRDALIGIHKLDAHQFMHGEPDPTHLRYNRHVHEFWNVNSMLKSLMGQGIPGITLVLIRDPEQELASYFCFAIRNGETLTVLTDREEGPHPLYNRMSRRPDRNLEKRAGKHWFPYQLLDLEPLDEERFRAKARTQLVAYQAESVPLKKVGELEADQFVWLVLMFDLIKDKFWKSNPNLKQLSYTGEMVVNPQALTAGSSIELAGKYQPLIVPPLEMKDVSAEATAAQWEREPTNFCGWIEKKYEDQVPQEVLNPVGAEATLQLAGDFAQKYLPEKVQEVDKAIELLRQKKERNLPSALVRFEHLSPITFGTAEKLQRDRQWVGRVNKMRYIQALADKDYREGVEAAKKWFEDALRKNLPFLQDAAARGELELPWRYRGFGSPPADGVKNVIRQGVGSPARNYLKYTYGIGARLHGGFKYRPSGTCFCINHPGTPMTDRWDKRMHSYFEAGEDSAVAYVHTIFEPKTPEAIATLLGMKVEEMHEGYQYWAPDSPYRGNSILDRLDPVDWVLHNPWMELNPTVMISTCKPCYHAARERIGLPKKKLVETKLTQEDKRW